MKQYSGRSISHTEVPFQFHCWLLTEVAPGCWLAIPPVSGCPSICGWLSSPAPGCPSQSPGCILSLFCSCPGPVCLNISKWARPPPANPPESHRLKFKLQLDLLSSVPPVEVPIKVFNLSPHAVFFLVLPVHSVLLPARSGIPPALFLSLCCV